MSRSEDTKGQILDAAAQLLAEGGAVHFGVNAVAARAGVAKPLLYRYFGGRDGLIAALVQRAGGTIARTLAVDGPLVVDGALAVDGPGGVPSATLKPLIDAGRALGEDRLARDLLAWSLTDRDGPDLEVTAQQHPEAANRDPVDGAAAVGPKSGPNSGTDAVAVQVILHAAMRYLLLARDRDRRVAGMRLDRPSDMARLENAMAAILTTLDPP